MGSNSVASSTLVMCIVAGRLRDRDLPASNALCCDRLVLCRVIWLTENNKRKEHPTTLENIYLNKSPSTQP